MDVKGRTRAKDIILTLRLRGMALLRGAVREVGECEVIGRGRCVMVELMQQVRTGGRRHVTHTIWRETLQFRMRRAAVTDRAEERPTHI